jgi:hypothetical protein
MCEIRAIFCVSFMKCYGETEQSRPLEKWHLLKNIMNSHAEITFQNNQLKGIGWEGLVAPVERGRIGAKPSKNRTRCT